MGIGVVHTPERLLLHEHGSTLLQDLNLIEAARYFLLFTFFVGLIFCIIRQAGENPVEIHHRPELVHMRAQPPRHPHVPQYPEVQGHG